MLDIKNENLFSWKEITEEFKGSCKELQLGELIKDDHFGLFEAMSAIEMMDPKMDAGMLQNQYNSKIKSIEQGISKKSDLFGKIIQQSKDNLLKLDNFTFDEKLAIIDSTLCHFVTWLDGASLAQTLFTNLYLHDPKLVKDQYIYAFSVTMLKLIELVRNKILSSGTYEEEDFQLSYYNFNFANEITDAQVVSMLKATEDASAKAYRVLKILLHIFQIICGQINKLLSLTKKHLKGELNSSNAADKSELEKEQQLKVDQAYGLWMRIKFLKAFYQIMHISDEYTHFSNHSEEISKNINNCLECLSKLNETHRLGLQPEIAKVGKTTFPLVIGFEPCINQRLLPPTFPRFIKIFSFESSVEHLNDLLKKLSELLNKRTELTLFNEIFQYGLEFNKKNQTVLSRSMFQLVILPRNGLDKMLRMIEILNNTVKKFISPPILNPKLQLANDKKEMCLSLVNTFMEKVAACFLGLFQVLGQNNARQREKLAHLMSDFASLQEEADNLDRILHAYLSQQLKLPVMHLICFGSWILHNTLLIMKLYLLSGFELDIYSKYEYHYIHWYLYEIIVNWQINTLTRVANFLLTAEQNTPPQGKANKKSKKKSSYYEKEISILTAERHMYLAYYQSLRALKVQNLIKSPAEEFDCEEFRFNHRFSPFQFFKTPQICYYLPFKYRDDQFINSHDAQKCFSFAQEHFDSARSLYEKHSQEFAAEIKVAKTNFVVMRLLSSGLKKPEKVDLDFNEHEHFPLFKL